MQTDAIEESIEDLPLSLPYKILVDELPLFFCLPANHQNLRRAYFTLIPSKIEANTFLTESPFRSKSSTHCKWSTAKVEFIIVNCHRAAGFLVVFLFL